MARLQIVQTDAEQPWHARVLAGNGQRIAHSENYAEERSAASAIAVLAEAFGITMNRPPTVDEETGGFVGETPEGVFHAYPVEIIDERATEEPEPEPEGDDA